VVVYSESEWAGDVKNQISVIGFIIYLLGIPICCRSKGQKGVTLSSIEVEYMAMSEAVKEICFIFYLLREMVIPVKLPIMVRIDNFVELINKNVNKDNYKRHLVKFLKEIDG
jgi:hypothetical protein